MRIAALDLGSNSFHLLVAEAGSDLAFTPLAAEKEMLYLGTAVAEHDGRIPEPLVARAADVVRRFARVAEAMDATELRAVATSAFRTATNADDLLERIRTESGVTVDVISGRREAELIFTAVRHAVVLEPAPALCADLGGGSLELIVGDATGADWLTSVPLGVGRLSARFIDEDPLPKKQRRKLHDAVMRALEPVIIEANAYGPELLVGSSGTFTDIAAMCAALRLGEVPPVLNQFTFTHDEFGEVASAVLAMDAQQRRKVVGLDARRVPVIAAGLVICGALLDLSGLDAMTVSEWALREGVLLDAAEHHDPADWSDDPRAIRRASVTALARRCSWPEAHSRHVAELALQLFDATTDLHGLDGADRELLEYAALVHDIGEHVAADGHHRHGAYLVMNGVLRGFDHREIAMIAALVRWHRRGEARAVDDLYGELDDDALDRVRRLGALLQIADGLDRGHGQAVRRVEVAVGKRVVLTLRAAPDEDCELEVWGARHKREQFEVQFGLPVEVVGG